MSYRMYVDDNKDFLPPNLEGDGGDSSNNWVLGNAQTDVNSANIRKGLIYQYNQQARYWCPASAYLIAVPSGGPYYSDAGRLLSAGQMVPQLRTCSVDIRWADTIVTTPRIMKKPRPARLSLVMMLRSIV